MVPLQSIIFLRKVPCRIRWPNTKCIFVVYVNGDEVSVSMNCSKVYGTVRRLEHYHATSVGRWRITLINTRRGARALTHPNEVGQRLIELKVPIDRGRVITVLTIQFRCYLRLSFGYNIIVCLCSIYLRGIHTTLTGLRVSTQFSCTFF